MSQVTTAERETDGATTPQAEIPLIVSREPLTASALPPLMVVDDPRGPYRFPLLQFIVDWNLSDDPAGLIADPPVYEGDDPVLLPAIAVVVHALADRAGVPIPGWVFDHRAPSEVVLFVLHVPMVRYGQWLRERSVAPLCFLSTHRVHIHPRMLDKGTPDWWLPWD